MSIKERLQAIASRTGAVDEEQGLIQRYINEVHGEDLGGATISGSGVSVWVVIADLAATDRDITDEDISLVAMAYDLPGDAIRAAIYYYLKYAPLIDARITLNQAAYW